MDCGDTMGRSAFFPPTTLFQGRQPVDLIMDQMTEHRINLFDDTLCVGHLASYNSPGVGSAREGKSIEANEKHGPNRVGSTSFTGSTPMAPKDFQYTFLIHFSAYFLICSIFAGLSFFFQPLQTLFFLTNLYHPRSLFFEVQRFSFYSSTLLFQFT